MPRLVDDRHSFKPEGYEKKQHGVSMLVREGFVVAHFDRMKSPLWVAQRWTKYDLARMYDVPSQDRPWREDLEVPKYARGGTVYDGNNTKLDRGHMARHAKNRAWGIDGSNWGCKMSNSAPQNKFVNRFGSTWGKLEDEIRDAVKGPNSEIKAVWTISGTAYRDKTNPENETPEEDFSTVVRLPGSNIGIPDATYKVVGWFDANGHFQARAYVFEQPHTAEIEDGEIELTYTLGNTKAPLRDYLVKIDDLEKRVGVNFFPMMKDYIEDLIEGKEYDDAWGAVRSFRSTRSNFSATPN